MSLRIPVQKVLCVAEKNDAAKGISDIMSNGRMRRVSVTCISSYDCALLESLKHIIIFEWYVFLYIYISVKKGNPAASVSISGLIVKMLVVWLSLVIESPILT